jgi:hypothetical protein
MNLDITPLMNARNLFHFALILSESFASFTAIISDAADSEITPLLCKYLANLS